MDSDVLKGAIFLALMVPVGYWYLRKSGEDNPRFTWVDGAVALGLVVVIVLMAVV